MDTALDEKFMALALDQARNALEAGEFPVGCVIAHKGKFLVNGSRQGTRSQGHGETDHAEILALKKLVELDRAPDCGDLVVYSTLEPCLMCLGALLIHGITRIVYAYEDAMGGGTSCDLAKLPPLYREKKLEVVPHVMRNQSLRLFQAFFSNPDNTYWKNSYLEEYTLRQP